MQKQFIQFNFYDKSTKAKIHGVILRYLEKHAELDRRAIRIS